MSKPTLPRNRNTKEQIDDLISQITNGHTEFDLELYFSEIFHEKTIEKDWNAYHVVWVTHGSRISEKMMEIGVVSPDAVRLDEKSRLIVADAIAEKIKKNYRILVVNVPDNHVHCLLIGRMNIIRIANISCTTIPVLGNDSVLN
ncbi:MAG: hypothetical protein R6V04_00440 [bacterium]